MSAKPTEAKVEKKVDEVAKQLSETKINGDEDAKAASKKADKKARQKAKKDALKVEFNAESVMEFLKKNLTRIIDSPHMVYYYHPCPGCRLILNLQLYG